MIAAFMQWDACSVDVKYIFILVSTSFGMCIISSISKNIMALHMLFTWSFIIVPSLTALLEDEVQWLKKQKGTKIRFLPWITAVFDCDQATG